MSQSPYIVDILKITQSEEYSRLAHKTQVFIMPKNDHVRTRMTHTSLVCVISKAIAKNLDLDIDLTEAIALGHDLGHAPFGHLGEEIINNLYPYGFEHNIQSARILNKLGVSNKVIEGVVTHRSRYKPKFKEAAIVRLADKIAYVNHDLEDSLELGILTLDDIPNLPRDIRNKDLNERLMFFIEDITENSKNSEEIQLSKEVHSTLYGLRKFLFSRVYNSSSEHRQKLYYNIVLQTLYEHFKGKLGENRQLIDYITGMTDRYALNAFNEL